MRRKGGAGQTRLKEEPSPSVTSQRADFRERALRDKAKATTRSGRSGLSSAYATGCSDELLLESKPKQEVALARTLTREKKKKKRQTAQLAPRGAINTILIAIDFPVDSALRPPLIPRQ